MGRKDLNSFSEYNKNLIISEYYIPNTLEDISISINSLEGLKLSSTSLDKYSLAKNNTKIEYSYEYHYIIKRASTLFCSYSEKYSAKSLLAYLSLSELGCIEYLSKEYNRIIKSIIVRRIKCA